MTRDEKLSKVRAAIKARLVDDNIPEHGLADNWLVPGDDNSAENMLDDMAEAALTAIES